MSELSSQHTAAKAEETVNNAQQPIIIQNHLPKQSNLGIVIAILVTILAICGLCSVAMVALFSASGSDVSTESGKSGLSYSYVYGNEDSKNKLLAIYIDQAILSAAQEYDDSVLNALVNGQYIFGYRVKDDLVKAAADPDIKGVVLYINSPGGTIVGAKAIADGVSYYREQTKKPVYAYVQDMAASGGYWAAASADVIYAEQGSLTGSIGVIMGPFEYYNKLVSLGSVGTQGGIELNYITGGTYKDIGNPTRKLTDEELTVLKDGVAKEYDKFVEFVASRRRIKETTIREDVKALIYGTTEALKYGLIDKVGTRDDVYSALAEKAGVANDFKVVKISSTTSLFGSMLAFAKDFNQQAETTTKTNCALCGKMLYFHGDPMEY